MESRKLLIFGPLPIRILVGITFVAHGLPKFEDIAGTVKIGRKPYCDNISYLLTHGTHI
jgi:uncharacterized membrane protein YphA (DoxX/SURF4 family)